MMEAFNLGEEKLTTALLWKFSKTKNPPLVLSKKTKETIHNYQVFVQKALESQKSFYGINTGFGYLSHKTIDAKDIKQLQKNLIRSHACGVAEPLCEEETRALMVLRAHTLAKGYSGVSLACVEQILLCLRHGILPIIPRKGSVGASGDLAPLAHLALGLIGEGEVVHKGIRKKCQKAYEEEGLKPYELEAKEGLALINGTHFMAALGALALERAKILSFNADVIAALSIDGFKGSLVPFDKRIQDLKNIKGQKIVAARILDFFTPHDEIVTSHKDCKKIQDPYSFRCIPQVHGACLETIFFVEEKINEELNAVTDNPIVFSEETILSGGNFHGQMMAFSLDFLAMACCELGSISERRIEKLTNPNSSQLPAFIVKNNGLNSGFMIPQYVAASLVCENRVFSHPASTDSIPTSAEKEDHVSMGPISANKVLKIEENLATILAIELICACQCLDFHKPLKPSPKLQSVYNKVRLICDFLEEDRSLSREIEEVARLVETECLL